MGLWLACREYGQGYRRRRGRCRGRRWIEQLPEVTYFQPHRPMQLPATTILLTLEELEALRLVDLEDLTQEEAAMRMGVSRKTLWNDLQRARKKVAEALVKGCTIRIQGGSYALYSSYPHHQWFIETPMVHPLHPPATHTHDEEKTKRILQLLPKTNCGACGYLSCMEYAKAIASGNAPSNACKVIDSNIKDKIKEILKKKEVR
ncbi:MAG TPA: DUF134 domain-containing protein [Thermoplasmata archaeon]|nr:DUF134 domain-containing protein [Thermoplasmata archaeon]